MEFAKDQLLKKIGNLGDRLPQKMRIYTIGGGAMSFRGDKESTKDVDWILERPEDLKILMATLHELGYKEVKALPEEYEKMGASAILRDEEGFQCDLFLRQVCNAMVLSEAMKERAEPFKAFGNLEVYLASREDIFLFKGITERERDLEDMLSLLRRGLDHDAIIKECVFQSVNSPRVWESFVFLKLEELEKKFEVTIPWKRKLKRIAEDAMAERLLLDLISKGNHTVKDLAKAANSPEPWIRKELNLLEQRGLIRVRKRKRPYRYEIA